MMFDLILYVVYFGVYLPAMDLRDYRCEAHMIKLLLGEEFVSVYTLGYPRAPQPALKLVIPIW